MTDSFTIRKLGGLASVFAFLSIIPMPGNSCVSLHSAARSMHLFPVVGATIGLVVGLFAWGVFEIVEPLLAGLLVSAVLLVITGLHHTDGLADMADGLMARGDHKRKLDAMKDRTTGTGGIVAVVLSIAGLVITLSLFTSSSIHVLFGIILAETLAKFSMVVISVVGKPVGNGTGFLFANAIQTDRRKMMASIAITIAITIAVITMIMFVFDGVWFYGIILVTATVLIIPISLAYVAKRCFGGITGDVIGATNDIVRIFVLAVFVSI